MDDSLQSRMIRAARLDPTLYDEVKADPRALPQAVFVVVLSALATGIGFGQGDLGSIGLGMLFALFGWWFTAYLAYFIGTRLFSESKDEPKTELWTEPPTEPQTEPQTEAAPADLLRTLGFANAPGVVRLLAAIPDLAIFVMLATTVWMICASVIAIRHGLSYQSTARAVGVYVFIQILLIPLVWLFLAGEPPVSSGTP